MSHTRTGPGRPPVRLLPHTTFFSYLIAIFPFLGLHLSQMVHLIPYDIDP